MSTSPATRPDELASGKSANLATLLGWFVPGAGQLYVGEIALGLIGLALIGGLYALGLQLSNGMSFEFLDAELRSPFATLLVPEVGNLAGLLYQMKAHGFGLEQPRPWPAHIALGSYLCALSGLLNVCWMAHANLAARCAPGGSASAATPAAPARARAAWHALAAWAVPGLGHWLQGRKLRALCVGLALIGLLLLGTYLAEGSNLSRERHFYYWGGQFLAGLPAAALEGWRGDMRVDHDIPWADAGLLLACLAGLLNILAMLDVYAWSEAVALGRDPLQPRGENDGKAGGGSKAAKAQGAAA